MHSWLNKRCNGLWLIIFPNPMLAARKKFPYKKYVGWWEDWQPLPPLLHLNNICYLSHKFQRKAGLNAHDVAFWQVATCISAFTFKLILGLKTMGPQAKKVSLSNTNCDNMMYMKTTIVGSVATYWSCFTKNNSPWIKLSLCAHWIFIIEVVLNLQLRKSQSSLTICL